MIRSIFFAFILLSSVSSFAEDCGHLLDRFSVSLLRDVIEANQQKDFDVRVLTRQMPDGKVQRLVLFGETHVMTEKAFRIGERILGHVKNVGLERMAHDVVPTERQT